MADHSLVAARIPTTSLVGSGFDDWCEDCGSNPVVYGGRCSSCQAEEDFYNCPCCHGTNCTRECEDEEDLT